MRKIDELVTIKVIGDLNDVIDKQRKEITALRKGNYLLAKRLKAQTSVCETPVKKDSNNE